MLNASGDVKKTNRFFFVLIAVSVFSPMLAARVPDMGSLLVGAGVYQQITLSEILLFMCALVFLALGGMEIFHKCGLSMLQPGTVLWIVLLSFLIQPVVTWINLLSMTFVRNHLAQDLSYANGSLLANLLYLALLPALIEEFISRGVLLQGLQSLGVRRAVLLSSLMFALLHLNFNQFFYAFVIGLVMALLVELTDSLYSSMLFHFLINARAAVIVSSAGPAVSSAVSSAAGTETAGMQEVLTVPNLLMAAAVYTPIMLLCAAGCIWVIRQIAKGCGREDVLRSAMRGGRGESSSVPAVEMPLGSGTVCLEASAQERTDGFLTIAFMAASVLAIVTMVLTEIL